MRRFDCSPVHLLDQPRQQSPGKPTYYFHVTPPGGEGSINSPKSGISLLFWPAGHTQPWGQPDEFEYHTLHEEIFFLSGAMHFGDYYTIKALGYLNHPPFWKHATNFYVDKDAGLLTMLSRGGEQPVVQLEKIPPDWNGQASFAPPTRSIGTRSLQFDDIAWTPLFARAGEPTGLLAKRISEDRDDGWTTWLMQAPRGWRDGAPRSAASGGDEIYVIEGDLTLPSGASLRKSGYVCDAHQLIGGAMGSTNGALFIRWTKGADTLWRVSPQV